MKKIVFASAILGLFLLGAGCSTTIPSVSSVLDDKDCGSPVQIAQFELIFGKGNVSTTTYEYYDTFRTGENTCTYLGYVPVNDTHYYLSTSIVKDSENKYFAWEKSAYEGAQVIIKSPDLFYKKLTILPEINFGKQRKQVYGWDVVSHVGDVTFSVSAVPQFADSNEETVRAVLDSVLEVVSKL